MAGKPQVSHLAEFLRLVPGDERLRMRGLIADADFTSHQGIAAFGKLMLAELFGGTLSVEVFTAARELLADISRNLAITRAGDDAANVSAQVLGLMREQQARVAVASRGAPLLLDVDPLEAATGYSRLPEPREVVTITVDESGRPT